jgi:hypothetical protein
LFRILHEVLKQALKLLMVCFDIDGLFREFELIVNVSLTITVAHDVANHL